MNTSKLIFALIVFIGSARAQSKVTDLPERLTQNNYLTVYENLNSLKFGTTKLSTDTTFDECYRLEKSGIIIEVRRNDTIYSGKIIHYIYAEVNDTIDYNHPIFLNKSITQDTAFLIYKNLKPFDSIPDMDSIPNWNYPIHGKSYTIEYATKEFYSLKSFLSQAQQADSIEYIDIINHALKSTCSISNTCERYYSTLIGT